MLAQVWVRCFDDSYGARTGKARRLTIVGPYKRKKSRGEVGRERLRRDCERRVESVEEWLNTR